MIPTIREINQKLIQEQQRMRTVYKYPFDITDEFTLELPDGAEILLVDWQHTNGCVWALVNPIAQTVERKFHVFGTGHPITDIESLKHVGSFMQGNVFVWHVFEQI